MAALAVVEDLQILEDRVRQLQSCMPLAVVEQLGLNPARERFHHGIVIAVADRAHRLHQARIQRPLGEGPGRELHAVIGMDHGALAGDWLLIAILSALVTSAEVWVASIDQPITRRE